MHLEFLVEDESGKKMLELLIPKVLGEGHTFNVHSYKGIGSIPKKASSASEAKSRILLDQLPRLLKGYGKTFAGYSNQFSAAVILVCDLDKKCLVKFKQKLVELWASCDPKPETRFCIAIEEGEAWLLGDLRAIKAAYPGAKERVLTEYRNDSICGTWERLADAVYPGGAKSLSSKGWQAVGAEKSRWAERITPHMDADVNRSPSFIYFVKTIKELLELSA